MLFIKFILIITFSIGTSSVHISVREENLFEELKVHATIASLLEDLFFLEKIRNLFLGEWQSINQECFEEILLMYYSFTIKVHISKCLFQK
jgi:hypothetical protein